MPAPLPISDTLPRRAECVYAVVALLLGVSLHSLFLMRAGALWRDEINSVNIARVETWSEIIANLEYDSFPAGWFVVLRPVASLLGPDANFGFRVFGVVIGVLLIAAVTFGGIDMTGRPPILSINLLLLNAIVIRFGNSIRGYGVGMLFAALTYWTIWRYAERRTRTSALLGLIVAIAGVHVLYYNAIIVFGTCVAAAVACWLRDARKAAAGAIAIGAVTAITLIPYLPVLRRARTWNDLVRFEIGLEWIHRMGATSIGHSGKVSLFLWYGALAFGVVSAGWLALRAARRKEIDPRLAFHAVTLVVGGAAYLGFLRWLSYYMAPWYYLGFLVLAAIAADALLGALANSATRIAIVLVLCTHVALSFGPVSGYVGRSATNMPLIAETIAKRAGPGDLVLLSPWECGVSWQRYYRGTIRWSTVPPISYLEWHRYDLLREAIATRERTGSLIELVDSTIASGRRVWVVTLLHYEAPPGPPPASLVKTDALGLRMIAHIQSSGYGGIIVPSEDNAISYERCSIITIVPRAQRP